MTISLKISEFAQHFVGRRCTGFVAGVGTGSHVTLEFEPRLRRSAPLSNSLLSEEQRLTEAEYSIFILCTWRLDAEVGVVTGAWDDNAEGGPMILGLERLVGCNLGRFEISEPGMDAILQFGDLRVRIFCDQLNPEDAEDNYVLFGPDVIMTVGTRSVIAEEVRSRDTPRAAPIRGVPRLPES